MSGITGEQGQDLWNEILKAFPILVDNAEESINDDYSVDHLKPIMSAIKEESYDEFIQELVVDRLEEKIRTVVAPEFWDNFYWEDQVEEPFETFRDAVKKIHARYMEYLPSIEKLEYIRASINTNGDIYGEKSMKQVLKMILRTGIHSQIPIPRYHKLTEEFYRISFKAFHNLEEKSLRDLNESGEENLKCGGCENEIEQCKCKNIIDDFHSTNKILAKFGLLERLAGEILTSLIHRQIESHVQETCKGSFDTSFIAILEKWLNTVVVGWLSRLYGFKTSPEIDKALNKFKNKLQHFLYETYTRTRIDQLFNIMIEFPDSEPAIDDLGVCLVKTELRGFLTRKLQHDLETRLLHPGVNTPDIITAYVASIRALRVLDPSGILLETVSLPIRQYLRCREDTMRCVVMNLTEEGPSELADEVIAEDPTSEENTRNWEKWTPDPIDAHTSKTSKETRSWDTVSLLVNVYGSKETFVHEYRNLLADRLLAQFSYNTEKEIRYLELLKLRFGDTLLHCCEVMLKDICDSKRINYRLHHSFSTDLSNQEFPLTAMILSAQFWPSFKEETLELPKKIKEHMAAYTKAFEVLKGNRTLCWKPHLGSVNLEIELKGRTISLSVSPIQAAIIWHFQEKKQWTIEELSSILMVPTTVLRRRIAFWQSQGLLKEVSPDTFLLVEESGGKASRAAVVTDMCEDDETESIMASAQDQREEELQVFWSYIVGMLTNLESLPPERIHQMLKMFASSSVECSLQQLRHFLDRKVREHKLLFSGGFYRLPK